MQHRTFPASTTHRRHHDIHTLPRLLRLCHRALVRLSASFLPICQLLCASPLIDYAACRIMAPRGSASSVFTEFESNGWSSNGLSCLVSLYAPVVYLTGADSSVHLSEELKNSAWTLPRSMLVTAISNYITSFIIVGTFSPLGCPYKFRS